MIRRKKRKHCVREGKPLVARTAANQEWALDFVHDAVACGRAIRVLSVIDAYTRECLALEVDTSFASRRVTRVLEAIVAKRGLPQSIRCDNGPELTSRHFLAWCMERQVELVAHSARKADAERAHREFPRAAAGRMLGSKLVSEPVRRAAQDCGPEPDFCYASIHRTEGMEIAQFPGQVNWRVREVVFRGLAGQLGGGLLCGVGESQNHAAYGMVWRGDTSSFEDASCMRTAARKVQ
jgi:transposase InsO family protein